MRAGSDGCGYLLKDRVTDITVLADAITRVARGDTVADAEGLTDRGIGERLWLTQKTVETHVRHILSKLNLPNPRGTTAGCSRSSPTSEKQKP